MDSHRTTDVTGEPTDDLSALAWVQEELRRSLDAAHKALRRFVKEAQAGAGSDVDAVDPAVLRTARQQIHQGVGALELVGLPAAATVLRACEAAVQRFVAKPHKLTNEVIDDIERASFALLDYVARILAGKKVSPLSLFPQYRAVQEAAGADRVHPADLWAVDWRWRELSDAEADVAPLQPDASTRVALEQHILALMRNQTPHAAVRMSALCAGPGAGAGQPQPATLWKVGAAMFEAQAAGLLQPDLFGKRVAARLLSQLRIIERGDTEVSERLAQDLLFFCAQAASPGDGRNAPRLAAVRQIYGLARHEPIDYSASPLGKYDPAWVAQGRKRVAAAKESWSAVAGGEMHRLSGLAEQFALVADSLKRLFPSGELLGAELQQASGSTQQANAAPPPALAMEVATGLLYIEACLEDTEFDSPEQAERVQRLSARIAAVRAGAAPQPLESWMEDLYRRVSDRQTMGSVVQELRASLSEVEKLIDQYFRNPADRAVLIPVPNQLSSMRGVLSVLGMDQASMALLRMRDEVDGLVSTEVDTERVQQAGVFDRLAGNLGALGFLIDMLSVQPQMAKALFSYDADAGQLNPVMGRNAERSVAGSHGAAAAPAGEPRLIEQAQMLPFHSVRDDVPVEEVARDLERLSNEADIAEQPTLVATVTQAQAALERASDADEIVSVRGQLSDALVDFVSTASDPVGLAPEPEPLRTAPAAAPAIGEDDEMREIFLEEAREVTQDARAACDALVDQRDDVTQLTTIRRAFHTLKGSSRMVGLTEFGDAAWACEQLYNARLAEQGPADDELLRFTGWALGYLGDWVEAIAAHRDDGHRPAKVEAAALALREPGAQAAVANELPDAATAPEVPAWPEPEVAAEEPLAPIALSLPADLPSAADLDLATPQVTEPAAPVSVLAFDLDFSDADSALQTAPVPLAEANDPAVIDALAAASVESIELIELDLGDERAAAPEALEVSEEAISVGDVVAEELPQSVQPAETQLDVQSAAEPEAANGEAARDSAAAPLVDDEQVKIVGPLRIGIPLFNIYLNEADELSRRLTTEVAEWAMELHRPIGETAIALSHSLAGSSATVGFSDLSHLARSLEHAQMRSQAIGRGTAEEARLFVDAAEEVRRLLHQFAAGFLKEPAPELLQRLAEHEVSSARRLEAASAEAESGAGEPAHDATAALAPEELPGPREIEVDLALDLDTTVAAETPVAREAEPAPDAAAFATSDFDVESNFGSLGVPELKPFAARTDEPARAAGTVHHIVEEIDDDIDAVDAVDAELFPIFEEEAQDLLPTLGSQMRAWAGDPADLSHASACMRTLHTLKGGARLAGAMRLGEMAHRLETRIERVLAQPETAEAEIDELQARTDGLSHTFEALRSRDATAYADAMAAAEQAAADSAAEAAAPVAEVAPEPAAPPQAQPQHEPQAAPEPSEPQASLPAEDMPASEAVAVPLTPLSLPQIDWSRFTGAAATPARAAGERGTTSQSAVRVRAPLLDRLVNQAGEVSITRSRIEADVGQIKGSLGDLSDNLERLRQQLRDIELQAETQMSSRMEAAKAEGQSFDPLEFDRFTRFQEITRMMAESVNDVATVQRTLQRTLESTEDELAAQARLTRDLQDDLLRTRMVEFEGLSDRLYRVVRQAAKETGKQVRLDIVGGSIEVDRGVLDRMTGAFEHLLRNSVTHGIESPETRSAAGKDAAGTIVVSLTQEGNEVGVEFRDDGAGLDLQRIRSKGAAMGLIEEGQQYADAELANLIFTPGFSTADRVTELSGRGIGMDVVRSEVNAMGGRIETATATGQGTSFKLVLPLTTAVTQVVMLRIDTAVVAVPSTLVEIVRRATVDEIRHAYESGGFVHGDRTLPFFWLGALLQQSPRSSETEARTRQVVVIRSAQQRIVLHIDEVLGNQEVVVKNLGPQLSRLPGLAGMTLLASGVVALIYNPVALATLYGEGARAATAASLQAPTAVPALPVAQTPAEPVRAAAPLVLVVDDSLTVRRVTQRLLVREGYRVTLAKDGLDALERLAEEAPAVVLSDIEMPRMDGFDLVRNIRSDARMRELPVIMITSRIAQKHRDYAAELGVDHYLGKPYSEEDLLALIGRYTAARALN